MKGMINVRTEINEIKTKSIEETNVTKTNLFVNINKIDKPSERLKKTEDTKC